MKRKLKIVGTLASLGLSLAMLVIGVYAATTVSFNITANVQFAVTDVFVDVEGKVFADPVASKGTTQVGETFSATSYSGTTPSAALSKTSWAIGTTDFTSTKDCIVYTLKITNVAKSGSVNVTVSSLPVAITGTSVTSKYKVDAGSEANLAEATAIPVNAGSYVTITITRTLTDKTKAISSTSAWAPTVTIANPAA